MIASKHKLCASSECPLWARATCGDRFRGHLDVINALRVPLLNIVVPPRVGEVDDQAHLQHEHNIS